MTILGPTFLDPQGKTLYHLSRDGIGGGSGGSNGQCPDTPKTVERAFDVGSDRYTVPRLPESQKACTQVYPPFVAASDATPVGDWTIITRDNGVKQWAYKGNGLYTSNRDAAPGALSSNVISIRIPHSFGWRISPAPLESPPGIDFRLVSRGLALADSEGRPLYYDVAGGDAVRQGEASGDWTPLLAPVAAEPGLYPDWSIVNDSHGQRVWAWKGHPLYTYSRDLDDAKNDGIGRDFASTYGSKYAEVIPGWQLALLQTASEPPPGLRHMDMRRTSYAPYTRVYGTEEGRPVYVATCFFSRGDNVDCDYVGDSPLHWTSFCGNEEQCKDWQPFLASPDAKPSEDGLWGVAYMNPSHPYKPLPEGEEGLRVWTWQGRFVFTYAKDSPGEVVNFYSTANGARGFDATTIPVFITPEDDKRNQPIR
jgi:predicted lipoprotein with Yx(FWY)xxD motif